MRKPAILWPILAAILVVIVWLASRPGNPPSPTPPPPVSSAAPLPKAPDLLESRTATPENPSESWERLLARDGSPTEDRDALADLVTNYLQALPDSRRPPLGANDEITRALTDKEALGNAALPANHPGIIDRQLMDRWGTPWHFHQQSADLIEVRSAGPDRRLFTPDDITPPATAGSSNSESER
ncbi:MAG: hypothetical protein MUF13_06070 [Akkermansiaceae bacterium]|jgi:hypothetical protein|nr:hypothetical protein [Akkermansiaceae bacterium]